MLKSKCLTCDKYFIEYKNYFKCPSCGLIWSGNKYDATIYDGDYFINYMRLAFTPESYAINKWRLYYVLKYKPEPKKILDYGAGAGAFVYMVKQRNKKTRIIGVDVYEHKAFGIYHLDHFWEIDRGVKQYDVITMWDVLEHVDNPWGILLGINSVMVRDKEDNSKNGLLFISTPNADARKQQEITSWGHWKPNEHLWVFNKESLVALLTACGYEIIDIDYTESAYRTNKTSKETENILTAVARPLGGKLPDISSENLRYWYKQYSDPPSGMSVYST